MTTETTYAIPTVANVTQQQVDDLLCTAFEGGITYWCPTFEVLIDGHEAEEYPEGARWGHETLTRGCTIRLTDSESAYYNEDEQPDHYVLTLEDFLKGIRMAAAHFRQSVDTFLEEQDADSADAAVQFALFDKLVYG